MAKRNPGPKRYAIYLRCSSDDQKHGEFTTIDVQREKDTEYVAKQGGVLVGVYADEGKSGTTLNRPDWKRLLADAQAGRFDAVCITYMSRLGRGNAYTNAEYELGKCGVSVEQVEEKFTDDLAGHVNKQMTTLMDGMYPKMVSQWTRTKMEQMVTKGYVVGRNVHFGYQKEAAADATMVSSNDKEPPKRFVPHPEEAPFVRRAFELFAETCRAKDVMDYLSEVTPKQWSWDNAMHLLRNDLYRGVLCFGAWVNETAHEPVISEELWQKVREADVNRKRSPKRNPVDDFTYYLRGLVRCAHCNCAMTPIWQNGRTSTVRYYACVKHGKKQTQCPIMRVNAETLHKAILAEIIRASEHPTRMNTLISEAVKILPCQEHLPLDLAAVNKRLRDTDKNISNIVKAVEQGASYLSLNRRLEQLEAERLALDLRVRELEGQIGASRKTRPSKEFVCAQWAAIIELWEEATEEERTEIMQGMVKQVEMGQKEEGTCELAVSPQVPSRWFELTTQLGAGKAANANSNILFPTVRGTTPLITPARTSRLQDTPRAAPHL